MQGYIEYTKVYGQHRSIQGYTSVYKGIYRGLQG